MDYEIDSQEHHEQPTAVMTATLPVSEIGPWLPSALSRTAAQLTTEGAGPAGPPFARYRRLSDGRFDIEAGFPAAQPIVGDDLVAASTLPETLVAHTVHVGPYDAMMPAYTALATWIRDHGHEPNGDPWEVYLSDPNTRPDPTTW